MFNIKKTILIPKIKDFELLATILIPKKNKKDFELLASSP